MLGPVRWVVWVLARAVLALRYRLAVTGLDAARGPGPFFVMPNHPGFCEPPNVFAHLWARLNFRPMLLETHFQNPALAPFAWLLRAIRVPDTAQIGAETRDRAAAAVQTAIDALKAGDNVIVWPSGHLTHDGRTDLGGARGAADILAAVPNVTVLLVRTRGLWGSRLSWARGKPHLVAELLRGVGLLLANLLLFTPRRRGTITVEAFPPGTRPEPTREAVNRWLEDWFNADTGGKPETPTYVPYHFAVGPRTFEFPPPKTAAGLDLSKVKPATKEAVAHIVEEHLKRPLDPGENAADTTFARLGVDSLDGMEITLKVEHQFGFTGDAVPTTLGQLWALAEGLLDRAPPKPPPAAWFNPATSADPVAVEGATIPEAVLTRAFKQRRDVILADDLAGGVTYERLVVGAWAMSRRFAELPSASVGLLLPASVAGDTALLAIMLAGKLPAVLNWTTGPANLGHAAQVMGLTHVVTSKAFIDRTQVQVPGTEFIFLEHLRAKMGKVELLSRLLRVRYFGGAVKHRLLANAAADPHKPAVVLFTSGSEKAPKAVPLTHDNILSVQRGIAAVADFTRADSILGFLPLFHSFGLSITGLMPLVLGLRVVHHPDPTDSAALVRKCAGYQATIVFGTPTFLGFLAERAKPGDFDALRLVVAGAEKAPPSLFAAYARVAPRAEVLEGYGITECAPVVSVNVPGRVKPGTVGDPIPGVRVCVTDLETDAVLPQGQLGMLLVGGPTIFPGYLGEGAADPFRVIAGERWYVTGDLAALDPTGAIVFHGRLKRFLKAGGEMISLPALEEPFTRRYPPTDAGPRVAVEGTDGDGGRQVVLFTTEPLTVREANAILSEEGFRGVMRLDEVRRVESLPVLGTGKTDYKLLRAQLG
ncbi:AMP-binding protein [Urbifossiella limnaea]|uniref:Bifunctional protein Aas n=1 Tax=Urbifossiella limnaea TaxID=2528023 RepID=A0A517Y126_9BACT|nr:AMP-binding protein [Urbifossiella limnaea]QDU23461.1 Bifunctional protein Aas [Urbifossiella limnaea]